MRKVIVTGGAGFIATNLIHFWAEKYPEDRLTVLDLLTYAGNLSNLKSLVDSSRLVFIKGDISDKRFIDQCFEENFDRDF